MTTRHIRAVWVAAALSALLMLSFANVQSEVMQTGMELGRGMPMCGASALVDDAGAAGVAMGAPFQAGVPHKGGPATPHGSRPACSYCAAAAHAPIVSTVPPLRASNAFVFTPFRVVASRGARGPPSLQPRARGPPVFPLIA